MIDAAHLDLDGAWGELPAAFAPVDARAWGPKVRYWGRSKDLRRLYEQVLRGLPRFVVYGSGDFHHLAAWLVRRFAEAGPVTVVSFDNHPDWDVRPPAWSCGCWVNRALEWPGVERVSVWGCGNFELAFPGRLFRNRRAMAAGRLEVHGWAERQSAETARQFGCMTREDWRERFEKFAESLMRRRVYVTVDMDCLRAEEAVTNWEQGLFTADEVAWAIRELRRRAELVGGDVCGAWSEQAYEQVFQRFFAGVDHPKMARPDWGEARGKNLRALERIWEGMVG